MKIFLDTANIEKIKKWLSTGLIDGVTTNPTHLSEEKKDPKQQVLEICSLLKSGEISVEVTEKNPQDVYRQAKEIAALSDNILVKIPCHPAYFEIIQTLVQEEIKLNITLVFTAIQGLMMAKLGVRYISPFMGRWDDIDIEGGDIIGDMRVMLDNYNFETKLLAASIRTVRNFHDAIMYQADAVTLPPEVFTKTMHHPLTDNGIKMFDEDWKKLGIKKFP
jgi:transaldolase